MVSAEQLDEQLRRLDEHPELTFFETLTAAAFGVFARQEVDCAVLEAGMGGRWDATRAVDAAVVGLTNVGTDHRRWLGEDRTDIARDKGAALAAAGMAVLGPGVDAQIRPHLGCPAAVPARELVRLDAADEEGTLIATWLDARAELRLPLAGRHQRDNLQLALAMALGGVQAGLLDGLDPAAVSKGVTAVRWPGRLSRHRVGERWVLVDAAHNLEGVAALARHLEDLPEPPNLLFSCLDDKPLSAMAALLRPRVGTVAVFPLDDERAMPVETLARAFPGATVVADAMTGLSLLPDPVLGCGSIRVVGELLAASEDGRAW